MNLRRGGMGGRGEEGGGEEWDEWSNAGWIGLE